MIGENPGVLIESNIIINLNDPCALTDISWIKPGKTTWPWWNGHVVKNENFAGGMNYQTMKHYIDFCAKNHIAYHSLTAHENDIWYGRSEYGVAHTGDLDPTIPLKELDFDKMLEYARDKNIGIRLWLNYDVFETHDMDSVLDQFQRWGIKGFMFDFIQRDDQHAVNLCLELVKKCADRHIEVKGRAKGTSTITITRNEILYGLNQEDKFRLAIVLVDENDHIEGPYYIHKPFTQEPEWGVASLNYNMNELIKKAQPFC